MRLVIDASTLVAEALRPRGRALLSDPHLDLLVTTDAWQETQHELRKRVALLAARRPLSEEGVAELLAEATTALHDQVTVAPDGLYGTFLAEAVWRIPRDRSDAPTVALALALNCGIWTSDHDFFGCGLPVWVTETLVSYLQGQAPRPAPTT